MSDFDVIGSDRLRAVCTEMVRRFAADLIIGFQFEGRDLQRIALREYELAAAHLGGPRAYGGRPMPEVHKPLRINRGHFRRRLAIMRAVMRELAVPDDVIERWQDHDRALEESIVDGTDCV